MKNNLFAQYGGAKQQSQSFQNGNQNPGPFKSMDDFFGKFDQFKRDMTEDPNEKLQQLLNNGTMSQEQYNMLYGLAKKILGK